MRGRGGEGIGKRKERKKEKREGRVVFLLRIDEGVTDPTVRGARKPRHGKQVQQGHGQAGRAQITTATQQQVRGREKLSHSVYVCPQPANG